MVMDVRQGKWEFVRRNVSYIWPTSAVSCGMPVCRGTLMAWVFASFEVQGEGWRSFNKHIGFHYIGLVSGPTFGVEFCSGNDISELYDLVLSC